MQALASELHRRAQRRFQRRTVKAFDVDGVWSVDLVDMTGDWVRENDGYRYILCVVDVFSRYAWVAPLRDKSAGTVRAAFQTLFRQAIPAQIWADRGSEFYAASVKGLFDQHDIVLYSTYSESKSVVVESFNRTLKNRMWRQFTERQDRRWVDTLEELVHDYNHSKHSSIGMTPAEAHTGKHNAELLERQEARDDGRPKKKPKFKVGDRVRISRVKGTFEKGYHPNWSYEVFTVAEALETKPATYRLRDHRGEVIQGSFYEPELQKTAQGDTYLVEKVLKTRTVKGKKQYLVKWLGYSEKDNSWVDEKDLGDVKKMK